MITKCIMKDSKEKTVATGELTVQERDEFQVQIDEQYRHSLLNLIGVSLKLYLIHDSIGIQIYVGKVRAVNDLTVYFSEIQKLQRIQRRNDVKIKMSADLMIHPVKKGTVNGKDGFICNVTRKIYIALRDISAGGIGFYSKTELEKDQLYLLVFPFTWTPVELLFTVLRSSKDEDGIYFYGCKFRFVSTQDERILRSFIYYQGLALEHSCSRED